MSCNLTFLKIILSQISRATDDRIWGVHFDLIAILFHLFFFFLVVFIVHYVDAKGVFTVKLIKSYYTKRIESAMLSSLFFERHSDRADKIKGVDSLSTVTNAIEREKKRFFFLENKE